MPAGSSDYSLGIDATTQPGHNVDDITAPTIQLVGDN